MSLRTVSLPVRSSRRSSGAPGRGGPRRRAACPSGLRPRLGRSAAGRGAGPMSTYDVRVTRIPIQPKRREQMRAAGMLPRGPRPPRAAGARPQRGHDGQQRRSDQARIESGSPLHSASSAATLSARACGEGIRAATPSSAEPTRSLGLAPRRAPGRPAPAAHRLGAVDCDPGQPDAAGAGRRPASRQRSPGAPRVPPAWRGVLRQVRQHAVQRRARRRMDVPVPRGAGVHRRVRRAADPGGHAGGELSRPPPRLLLRLLGLRARAHRGAGGRGRA
jgi:hypothetical protein